LQIVVRKIKIASKIILAQAQKQVTILEKTASHVIHMVVKEKGALTLRDLYMIQLLKQH
jgi:hypothetical protein